MADELRTSKTGSMRRRMTIALGVVITVAVIAMLAFRQSKDTTEPSAVGPAAARTADSVVTLDSTAQRLAGIEVVTVNASGQHELSVNGTITFDAERVSVIAPRAEGRLMKMMVDLGHQVAEGQDVAVVESPEIGQIRGDLERARAAVDVAKRNYEREKRLYEQNISPQKEMLDAEVIYRVAEADVKSAQAKLQTYGATSGEGGSYSLSSAVAGTVVERNGSPGQIVGPLSNVFTVADLRHLWISVDVYEADFSRVRVDAPVTVTPVAFPGERFLGRVLSTGGIVDTASHTFKVRVHVENPAQRLRPGMFAQVRIRVAGAAPGAPVIALPEIAVQEVNGKSVVFVATSVGGRFVARPVTPGARTGSGDVVINSGLRAGDRVVVKGAFQLKAELTKASLGEGGHHD